MFVKNEQVITYYCHCHHLLLSFIYHLNPLKSLHSCTFNCCFIIKAASYFIISLCINLPLIYWQHKFTSFSFTIQLNKQVFKSVRKETVNYVHFKKNRSTILVLRYWLLVDLVINWQQTFINGLQFSFIININPHHVQL